MKYLFRSIRFILGYIIYVLDWLTRPPKPRHTPEQQDRLNRETANLALYHFKLCPFCVKTRRKVHKLGLDIELRDARNDPRWNKELVNQGGKYQVPCLRIQQQNGEVTWLYESSAINEYLEQRFSASA